MQHRLILLLASCLVASACGYDSNGPYDPDPAPDTGSVVGRYQATAISNTVNDTTIDLLEEAGLTFTMSLEADGTMSARYTITTGTAAPGNSFDVQGSWVVAGTALTLNDTSNSFISQVPFTIVNGRLEGTRTIDQAVIRVVLERTGR